MRCVNLQGTQIYIIRKKLRNIQLSFFLWYAQKQFLRVVVWAFPLGMVFRPARKFPGV